MKRVCLGATVAACAWAALAAPASADPGCSWLAPNNGTLTVSLDNTAASAKLTLRRSGNNIQVIDANGVDITTLGGMCTGQDPTVTNTSVVLVEDLMAGHNATVVIDEQGGTFDPGNNGPSDPEISFEVQFGGVAGGTADALEFDGTDNADNFLLGEDGAGVLGGSMNPASPSPDLRVFDAESADINGRKGDDTISAVGNAGVPDIANPLTLADGKLLLEGGNQNDTLRGGAGADKLDGGTQDDDLNGGGGNDNLDGGADNDSLDGGVGADNMIGNTGTDIATYAGQTGAVNVTLDGAANDGGTPDNLGDNVQPDVENVNGGNGADTITGSALDNVLTGNAGNDTLDGGAGNDKLSGIDGDDRLLGNVGNDNLFGGNGKDNQVGGSGNDKITGNLGKDIFLGKKGLDRLIAKAGDKDKKIDCGPGSNKHESFTRDHKDPKPKSC